MTRRLPGRAPGRVTDDPAPVDARSVSSRVWSTRRVGLGARLFLSDLLVVLAGATTLLTVSMLFAPVVFHDHLQQANLPVISPAVREHVDMAFDQALLISLVIATTVAGLTALTVSWLVARRLAAPVHEVASAARRLADGHYLGRLPDPRLGPEFASLIDSMNRLSRRLAAGEADRHRLTADLAHQLRTPVASVQATVEAVQDGVLPVDEQTLAVLADQTARLHRLIADLEKVSRAEERQVTLHADAQPLAPLVHRCVDGVRDRYRIEKVALEVEEHHTPPAPAVRIDPDRIGEALTNLLDNALRHTPSGGRVIVALAGDVVRSRPVAVLTVRDSGEGFAPEQAARLFERFYRAPSPAAPDGGPGNGPGPGPVAGSGLGLTIARALVEAHGGTLEATSPGTGRGATFTITLPAT